jgi:hypothetical protein
MPARHHWRTWPESRNGLAFRFNVTLRYANLPQPNLHDISSFHVYYGYNAVAVVWQSAFSEGRGKIPLTGAGNVSINMLDIFYTYR